MRTLALDIGENTLTYAIYDDIKYVKHDVIKLDDFDLPSALQTLYKNIKNILSYERIGLAVMTLYDTSQNKKELTFIDGHKRGVVKLLCSQLGVVFQEYKVDGWFKAITKGKNTVHKKKKALKQRVGFVVEEKEIIDTILLAYGVSNGILQINKYDVR